jgi:hypothetical protein
MALFTSHLTSHLTSPLTSFHNQMEKDRIESALQVAKREVTLLAEKEAEYAKQNFLKTKEIKVLRER